MTCYILKFLLKYSTSNEYIVFKYMQIGGGVVNNMQVSFCGGYSSVCCVHWLAVTVKSEHWLGLRVAGGCETLTGRWLLTMAKLKWAKRAQYCQVRLVGVNHSWVKKYICLSVCSFNNSTQILDGWKMLLPLNDFILCTVAVLRLNFHLAVQSSCTDSLLAC